MSIQKDKCIFCNEAFSYLDLGCISTCSDIVLEFKAESTGFYKLYWEINNRTFIRSAFIEAGQNLRFKNLLPENKCTFFRIQKPDKTFLETYEIISFDQVKVFQCFKIENKVRLELKEKQEKVIVSCGEIIKCKF